ncbi:MAG TPA: lipoprotein signal peptidase [Bacteroidales bacterium]|nr:lipoprotein signal peptidase [Bacteroidales bacterium]
MVAALVVLLLLVDQALKVYIKLNYHLGEIHEIFPWFSLCFVENDGMAFGIEWFDKLFLTLFRMVLVVILCWYMHRLIQQRARVGFILTVALVIVGALGNIIDCLFYGVIFSESTFHSVATIFPASGGGYAPFFYGKVVDMLYFPLIHNSAGEVLFFRPVFNLADSCITCAVIIILLFYRRDLNDSLEKKDKNAPQSDSKTE